MTDIAFLDELAANARPARVQQALEGWRLRASDGITRRANSVLCNAPTPMYPGWLEYIEGFYRRQDLPARYQISPASPPALDALLDAHGYVCTSETSVMTASAEEVVTRAKGTPDIEVTLEDRVSDDWLNLFLHAEGFPQSQGPGYKLAFSSLGPAAAFVQARLNEEPAAVGMSVAERGWAGLFSIVTFPQFRRRGIAREVVRVLASWALAWGAANLYLQVVAQNEPAVHLYTQLGFSILYSYHYREKTVG
jgi:GNAT superfamily N-acetyltransferase